MKIYLLCIIECRNNSDSLKILLFKTGVCKFYRSSRYQGFLPALKEEVHRQGYVASEIHIFNYFMAFVKQQETVKAYVYLHFIKGFLYLVETFGSGKNLEMLLLLNAPLYICYYIVSIDTLKNTEQIIIFMFRIFALPTDNRLVRFDND